MKMETKEYQIDGFLFQNKEDYERAMKEQETVSYLKASLNVDDTKALLKIYNRSVEKESFRTVIGLQYMKELRDRLVASGIASEEAMAPIPVRQAAVSGAGRGYEREQKESKAYLERQVKRYQEAYESARTGRTIKNLLIVVLVLLIFAMLFVTYKTQYSVFTYFTDYKEKMREELLDEYEGWQEQLEQKEQELKEWEAGTEGGCKDGQN